MEMTLTAISRPVFILMLVLASIVLGALSYSGMRKELNPEVNFGTVTITTVYTGAGPEEVNTLVTRKVEDAVSGVNGIREVTATSQEGQSVVTCSLNLDVNTDNAVNDVRSKVDAIASQLPKEADKPTINKVDLSASPIIYMGFSAAKLNNERLRDLIDNKIKDRFAQIPGVSQVDVQGGDVREIQVQVNKDKLLAYGIGITDVQKAVANSTLNIPSGHIISGDSETNVRVLGEYTSVDQLRNLIFTIADPNNKNGKPASVRLGDVAQVFDAVQERTTYSRINGKDAIVMVLSKTTEGNAIDVSAGARAIIKQVQTDYKDDGIKVVITQDQSTQISDSLNDLNFTLVFSVILVCGIVYMFLHNFRGMLIVGLAIPTCMFITFIVLKVLGFTINNMSMLALSLAVGVLVDDAIVVLENIYRHLQMGESPRDAAINGRMEIGLAALAITMADVVVFLPLAFLSGVIGQFFRPLAVGYMVAVVASLFVSFTLTPMLASRWYRKNENVEHPTGLFSSWFERSFGNLERRYGRVLEWCLNHRWFVFIAGNILLVAVFTFIGGSSAPSLAKAAASGMPLVVMSLVISVIAVICNFFFRRFKPQLILYGLMFSLVFPAAGIIGYEYRQWKKEDVFKFQFFPSSDAGSITASIELPAGASLAATEKVVEEVENRVKGDPNVKFYLATVGSQGVGQLSVGSQGSNYAQLVISLFDKPALLDQMKFWQKSSSPDNRKLSSDEVQGILQQKIGHIPGATVLVAATDAFGGGHTIQLSFRCEDRDLLTSTVAKVADQLRSGGIKGLVNINVTSKPGRPEIRALPDRARLADSNISVNDLSTAMRTMYQGDDTVKYRVNGEEYTIRTMLNVNDRNNPQIIDQLPITFQQGNPIFVPGVATLQNGRALDKIDRRDREEEIRIEGDVLTGYAAGTIQSQISQLIANDKLPAAVRYKPLGQADSQAREGVGLIVAVFIGLMLIYMLLASLYDNLLYPFIIQLAQPQAFVGAILGLIITNKSLSLIGFIGLIVLMGLVGKSAILLVDYTNTLRERGRNRHDALVEAGPIRLRPILMTALALVLGMMPVALALGRGSEFRETIGITTIGGMILSTFLTLFVIPCSYTIFDDFSLLLGRGVGFLSRIFMGRTPAEESSVVEPELPLEADVPTDLPKS